MKAKENLINTYELTLLFSPDLSEMDLSKTIDKVKKSITSKEGEIKQEHSWGKKRLAYFIQKFDFGNYHTLVFTLPKTNVNEIIKELELSADVLRYLNLCLEKEGIEINDLFTPEKEAAMIANSIKEKLDPKTASVNKKIKSVKEVIKPTVSKEEKKEKLEKDKPIPEVEKLSQAEQEKRRKDLDKKLDELLKDKE